MTVHLSCLDLALLATILYYPVLAIVAATIAIFSWSNPRAVRLFTPFNAIVLSVVLLVVALAIALFWVPGCLIPNPPIPVH